MKHRIWIAIPALASALLLWSVFLHQHGTIHHLQAEVAELRDLNATLGAEVDGLRTSLSSVRVAQATSEALLNSAAARLANLEAQTNRLSQNPVASKVPHEISRPSAEPNPLILKRPWSPEQAEGPPDTFASGDLPTAWAPREQDGGPEWLRLEFANWVEPAEIRVRETFNPGAITHVTVSAADGQEVTIWSGVDIAGPAPYEASFANTQLLVTRTVTVHLDTARVPGWNEIDAVELIGRDGSRQWATKATASSSYADRSELLPISPRFLNESFRATGEEPVEPADRL